MQLSGPRSQGSSLHWGRHEPGAVVHLLATAERGHQERRLDWTSVYHPGCLSPQSRYIRPALDTCCCWDWEPRGQAGGQAGGHSLTSLLSDPNPGTALLQASVRRLCSCFVKGTGWHGCAQTTALGLGRAAPCCPRQEVPGEGRGSWLPPCPRASCAVRGVPTHTGLAEWVRPEA